MITHLVLDGVTESCLGVGIDIVGSAASLIRDERNAQPHLSRHLQQRVVSVDGRPVQSGAGRPVAVDGALSVHDMGPGDVLVVPGWFAATDATIGSLLCRPDTRQAIAALAGAAQRHTLLAVSCSATFMVAAAGLLDGQRATTTWWLSAAFARQFPAVRLLSDRMLVEAPGILTAGSAFAHADLMLAVISRLGGPTLAQRVARYLVLDHRASQARYMVQEHLRVSDPVLQKLEQYILTHLDQQVRLDALAAAVSVSPRTLARRTQAGLGMTPQAFVQRLRIAHAAHLLDTTSSSVEDVAARVGYADPAAFRRLYRRLMGHSPRGLRSSPTPG